MIVGINKDGEDVGQLAVLVSWVPKASVSLAHELKMSLRKRTLESFWYS
jgi:hypothetical protein